MNHIASMRKMRPLEPAGSEGSTGAAPGLGAAAELADFFVGGKVRFYRKCKLKIPLKLRLHGAPGKREFLPRAKFRVSSLGKSRCGNGLARMARIRRGITPQTCNPHTSRTGSALSRHVQIGRASCR